MFELFPVPEQRRPELAEGSKGKCLKRLSILERGRGVEGKIPVQLYLSAKVYLSNQT
jgi:hypothetical protein